MNKRVILLLVFVSLLMIPHPPVQAEITTNTILVPYAHPSNVNGLNGFVPFQGKMIWLNFTASISNVTIDTFRESVYFTSPYASNTYMGLHYNGSNLAYYAELNNYKLGNDFIVWDTFTFNENVTLSMNFNDTHNILYVNNNYLNSSLITTPYETSFVLSYRHINMTNNWVINYSAVPIIVTTTETEIETETVTNTETETFNQTDYYTETDYTTETNYETSTDHTIQTDYETMTETEEVTNINYITETIIEIDRKNNGVLISLAGLAILIGVIRWLITRPKSKYKGLKSHKICNACGTYHTTDSRFCIQCGARI